MRNLEINSYNQKVYPDWKRSVKTVLGFLVSMILVILSVSATLAIMILKTDMSNRELPTFLVLFIPPVLNLIAARIFSKIYSVVSEWLNNYENHRTSTEYENSLVYKVFFFGLFNGFNSFIIIAFFKNEESLFGECPPEFGNFTTTSIDGYNMPCYNELISYVRTFFIVGFFVALLEIVLPGLKGYLMKPDFPVQRDYDWGQVDTIIEKEWERPSYKVTKEVDSVVLEYQKIVLLFTAVSMFGATFPLGFALAFIISASALKIDRFKFIYTYRRPTPQGAQNIGSWSELL